MADDVLLEKVHALSDLELAALLCLTTREHCLISTPAACLDDLVQELQLVASKTFGLDPVVIDCTPSTTLQDFASGLLIQPTTRSRSSSPLQTRSDYFTTRRTALASSPSSSGLSPLTPNLSRIANVVLARNLDRAPHAVQIQALELLRTRRIFTRTAVQTAPKQFLLVPVLAAESGGEARVTGHLNDFFAMAHWHDPEDGFGNLDEEDDGDTASTESVVKRGAGPTLAEAVISESEISHLAKLSQQVKVPVEVTRYMMNIVSFLRMHRAVASGVTPSATNHLTQVVRCLAPLHKLDFVTTALVGVAAKKVYLHRIRIVAPDQERSLQWGSRPEAVRAELDGVGPEGVIEDVLETVPAPQ